MQQDSEGIQRKLQILRSASARAAALVKLPVQAQVWAWVRMWAMMRARMRALALAWWEEQAQARETQMLKQMLQGVKARASLAQAEAEAEAEARMEAKLARMEVKLARARARTQARAQARVRAWMRLRAWEVDVEVAAEVADAEVRAKAQANALEAQASEAEAESAEAEAGQSWIDELPGWQVEAAVTYGEVLADSELMDIIYSIKPENRHGLAHKVWHHSEHWWFIQIIAPITRLPQELLHQILLILIDDANHSPLVLMQVSKHWYSIVAGIWASLKLGTTTPRDAVTRKLEGNQWLLDVVVDTEVDRGDLTPSEDAYQAIFAAMQAASRWRSLIVETFPAQTESPEHLVNSDPQQCSDAVMSRLRTLKIKCPCEPTSLLRQLLRMLGTASGGELTTVEINSPSVISFLAPTHPSIFHSVKVLCLDIPRLPNPVDLLPHLHQLEALTASHVSLPIYPNDVDIPFVHTLRHLSLRAVSIQWMSGRTFHALESCTLLFPLHRHVQHTFSTTLPKCNDLTFQGYPLDILSGISARNLTHLTVKCSCSDKPRGSRQLGYFSGHALRENRFMPRILHISIEATNQAWIKAFAFMSNLEELVIDSAHPSSLGANVLQALVVRTIHANNLGTTSTHGGRYIPLCPSLKRFGLRYRRWLRSPEHFDLFPELVFIILSRQQSEFPLESFRIWKESGQQEPLELIERSWISSDAFKRLKDDEDLLHLVDGGNGVHRVPSNVASLRQIPRTIGPTTEFGAAHFHEAWIYSMVLSLVIPAFLRVSFVSPLSYESDVGKWFPHGLIPHPRRSSAAFYR